MKTLTIFDNVNQVSHNSLSLYKIHSFSNYPQLKHAIFTRKGGVSRQPFDTLNLSISVGDSQQAVNENVRLACQAVGVKPQQTVSCHLVHSADVMAVTPHNRRQVAGQQVDGLITKEPDTYLFMRFGDCVPLVFFDPVQQAIGLTHAGWRGTMQNAAGATVQAMVNRLDCRAENIIAAIGPSIGPCCYEVGSEVMEAAAKTFNNLEHLFIQRNGRTDRAHFDMWAANRQQLAASGVTQIVDCSLCTACRTDEFFSHRAEAGRTGRFGVIIGLPGKSV